MPKDVDLSAQFSTFGKAEVEKAAEMLVRFFQYKGSWCSFTFGDLVDFYRRCHVPDGEMLFGLFGSWYDDGGGGAVLEPAEVFILHDGGTLHVTDDFLRRVQRYATPSVS